MEGGFATVSESFRGVYDCESAKVNAVQLYNFIKGEFDNADLRTISNFAPASGALIAHVPNSSKDVVDRAVSAAKKAFPAMSQLPMDARSKILNQIADLLEQNLEHFAYLESVDTGKPLWLCKVLDIPRAVHNLRFFASAILHDQETSNCSNSALNYSQRSPYGVVGLITPWNLPLYLLTWKLAPALAMGNTVVLKPSELTPMTAHALMELIKQVEDLPAGAVNLVSGVGAETGQSIVDHPDVKMISFTGGTVSGRIVALSAAPMFKKVSLELGGKNASIVFADCDFEKTVEGVARAAFLNQGEICLCGSRIFVEESLYASFVERLVEVVTKNWTVGNPFDQNSRLGSLVSKQHLGKIEYYVDLALREGGKIACGGKRPKHLLAEPRFADGAFYEPTIIEGLDPVSSRVATEEIFGPVVTIHPFSSEEEVLELHNRSEYGLAGSVWTQDLSKGHRVAQSMDTGMVWVNCWLLRDLRVPFGGVKNSGLGREGGKNSLETFSQVKNICIKL
eukprot:TRINITY_DN6460_c0_g1_i3.p1 TRINITY_DN6460_c0_g1~~TRINITY_DN6460_c0_g1_i3.p1  ORF type:complete len:509 (-),score=161.32 TRINITY_DN6460_c0_g1_i3:19-1545(-)